MDKVTTPRTTIISRSGDNRIIECATLCIFNPQQEPKHLLKASSSPLPIVVNT
ncbi:MAG: hypothetical protein Q4E68_02890 [Prevotellaceae bacterium]|nr:hypothetical protein [Prevotellaceae bacterium]